ncbi:hypothetical protein BD626DRAFT_449230 [Schizophyllum amplum]|uniref:Uncharacterized protein n=1 Tax=Schizophyllum amplum TaxID=97359 RepID=A0A550D0Q6_9AGAR|nr:hypothetical protein BD626DRAFT_449230 [Auriculariopsis ampla]
MSVPLRHSYVVVWIDAQETLAHLEDEEVKKSCNGLTSGKYVAMVTRGIGLPIPGMRYHTYTIDFLVQGLPADDSQKNFVTAMSCPVLPNTSHPEGRRPLKAIQPLPWPDCYHRAMCCDTVKFRLRYSNERPQCYLNIPEAMLLERYISEDCTRMTTLRKCATSGSTPPLHVQSNLTRLTVNAADEQYSDRPDWEDIPANSEFDEEEGSYWQADDLQRRDAADKVYGGESLYTDEEDAAEDSGSEASAEDELEDEPDNDFGAAVLAAMIGHEQDGGVLRMVLNVSYDLSLVDSPPDPAGYFKEMEAIAQIEEDFKQRMLRNIEDVKRKDEEYMTSLAARSSLKAPDAAKAEIAPDAPPEASHVLLHDTPEPQDNARKASVERDVPPSADVDASEASYEKSPTAKVPRSPITSRKRAAGFARTISLTLKRAFTRCWPRRNAPRS